MTRHDAAGDMQVTVRQVYRGPVYARVSTIGDVGARGFVLVPGIGVSSDYFERLAPYLNEFGPVHALDLPGFGGVPHPETKMTIEKYGDMVGAVIDELGLQDPVLVGQSMGAQIVTDLAARRHDFSTLVLIGPVVNESARTIPAQAVNFIRCAAREPGKVKALALSSYLLCGFRWFSRVLPEMMSYPIEDRIASVRASTLVIRGEHDYVCPPDWVRQLVTQVPDGRAWQIPDAAHSVMHAHAPAVAALCVRHARNPGRPAADAAIHHVHEPLATHGQRSRPQSWREVVQSLIGRGVEWSGLIRHNEARIARGKSRRARAVLGDDQAG